MAGQSRQQLIDVLANLGGICPHSGPDWGACDACTVDALLEMPMKVWAAMVHYSHMDFDAQTGEPTGPPYCPLCSEVAGAYVFWPCRFAPVVVTPSGSEVVNGIAIIQGPPK